jgi:hypothetical protein
VPVPQEVRAAAVAAFGSRLRGRSLLELLRDDDAPLLEQPPRSPSDAHRELLFGDETTTVRVGVRYAPPLAELTVHVVPLPHVELEVIGPEQDPRIVVRGSSPLHVATRFRGPTALLVTGEVDGQLRTWQTSWVTL